MSPWRKTKASHSRKARAVVLFPPSGFADDYDLRPDSPVEIGIRALSVDTLDTARAWAAKKASRRHQNLTSEDAVWCEAFNEALMQWIVARCTCKPNDILAPYWSCAEEVVPVALSAPGLLRLFEEHELLAMGTGVLSPELGTGGCAALGELLIIGEAFAKLSVSKARYARRLLSRVVDIIDGNIEVPADPNEDSTL